MPRPLNVLDAFSVSKDRGDAHIGQYTTIQGNSIDDCLHWCLPGPPDDWNALLAYFKCSHYNIVFLGEPIANFYRFAASTGIAKILFFVLTTILPPLFSSKRQPQLARYLLPFPLSSSAVVPSYSFLSST